MVPTTEVSGAPPGGDLVEKTDSAVTPSSLETMDLKSPKAYINRELSWLGFARRVLSLVANRDIPLMERVRFAGIMGMLHSEFFMKRMSGLKRQIKNGSLKLSLDGRNPREEFEACRLEVLDQAAVLAGILHQELLPALAEIGQPILQYRKLAKAQQGWLRTYFEQSVRPILTPLAVDSEHPFPFISNLGLNLAVLLSRGEGRRERFLRIKVPNNRPRWVSLPDGKGYVPLEQVIAANLDLIYPSDQPVSVHFFQVTRGAEGDVQPAAEDEDFLREPGGLVQQVSSELKARRFAGVVRLQVNSGMPKRLVKWLTRQLKIDPEDVYSTDHLLGLSDLLQLKVNQRKEINFPVHTPVDHPRLQRLNAQAPETIFEEIAQGDILLHHPYHNFESSVLRFLESASLDPEVLAIKLTIYRTSSDSPIVRALAEAARRGKQVAVLVEITARFDEAPNIAWGKFLEKEGVHVAYGVERLKTHVKLALVVREEKQGIRRYAHVGTGNYHTGTAKVYEDLGVLTCDPTICEEVASLYNALTGGAPHGNYRSVLVAPVSMRRRFVELIRREVVHERAGRPSGIYAKLNQVQDPNIIRELYLAGSAGVPITLNVRGLCCLRVGAPGLSENIRVYSVVGRFLEHSRIFRFTNGGDPEYYLGSADWMKRNLNNRVETIMPIHDRRLKQQLDEIIAVYEEDNCSAWDAQPDGSYVCRHPAEEEPRRNAQETFIRQAEGPPDRVGVVLIRSSKDLA